MLDIEVLAPAQHDGLNIVSLAEMKKHLRIVHTALDDQIEAAVREAAAGLHGGQEGTLNRTVFPCTWVRYLPAFPSSGIIRLPYPPLINVESVGYFGTVDESPIPTVPASDYIVRTVGQIPEVVLLPGKSWPSTAEHPRAVRVTYRAGYEVYPEPLRRLVKILAAHYVENAEATINDRGQTMVSRRVEFGVDSLMSKLRVMPAYDDWE